MATPVEVPPLGESVKQALLIKWHKSDGESVSADEPICELETDKANVDVPAPVAGVLRRIKEEGDSVAVGEAVARIEESAAGVSAKPQASAAQSGGAAVPGASQNSQGGTATLVAPPPAPATAPAPGGTPKVTPEDLSPAVRALVMEHGVDVKAIRGTGPGGRVTKEDVQSHLASRQAHDDHAGDEPADQPPRPVKPARPAEPDRRSHIGTAPLKPPSVAMDFDSNGIHRTKMSKMRVRIGQTLVAAQQTAAILTTFNEVDMTGVMDLRSRYKERFQEVHGIGLGFMSFFARAAVLALREFPRVNAFIEGEDIIYHNYVHLGIAVSTDRGLAVPVLRNVQDMSFARIEAEIKRLATATRDGKLGLEELSGGTFTITNGGVFGSLLSTPIINPPQSGILGMHAILKRPVVVGDKIEPRSMMYVALSYDHRLVDGRESVSFLVRLKQLLEDPARLMLEI